MCLLRPSEAEPHPDPHLTANWRVAVRPSEAEPHPHSHLTASWRAAATVYG